MARLLTLLILLLAAAAPALAADPVILISIDGFRADYIQRGLTPTLAHLARDGVTTTAMHPPFPSLTYPSHYSMVTGLQPDHHGVIGNKMLDASFTADKFFMTAKTEEDPRWWEGGIPIWETAQKAGMVVASAGWPGSEGLVHGIRANYLDPWRAGRKAEEIMAVALNWLDLPPQFRPSLELLYFEEVDKAGHDHGPDSAELNTALAHIDAALATLQAGLAQRGLHANIIIVSDHGMSATSNAKSVVMDDWFDIRHATVIDVGAVSGIDPLPGYDAEIGAALAKPLAHATCWRKSQIPQRLHFGANPRVSAFVCTAEEGWRLETRADMAAWNKDHLGDHGYDPAIPRMDALFVADGPAFRPHIALAPFDNVDVYPLLARLTGLMPEKNDGSLAIFAPALNK